MGFERHGNIPTGDLGRPVFVLLVLTALGVFLLSGCAKDAAANGTTSAKPTVEPVNFAKVSENRFKATGEPSQEPLKERFNDGCEPGTMANKLQFHRGLAAGQKFRARLQQSTRESKTDMISSFTVKSVEAGSARFHRRLEATPGSQPVAVTPIEFEQILEFKETAGQRVVTNRIANPSSQLDALAGEERESCFFENGKLTSRSETPGTYSLVDGSRLLAYKVSLEQTGKVVCRKGSKGPTEEFGSGTITEETIFTNEVVSTQPSFCGGSSVMSVSVLKSSIGTVFRSDRTELQAAPQVTAQ